MKLFDKIEYLVAGNPQKNIELLAQYTPLENTRRLCTEEVDKLTPSSGFVRSWLQGGSGIPGFGTLSAIVWSSIVIPRAWCLISSRQPTWSDAGQQCLGGSHFFNLDPIVAINMLCMTALSSLVRQMATSWWYRDDNQEKRLALLNKEYAAIGRELSDGKEHPASPTTVGKIRFLVESGVLGQQLQKDAGVTALQAQAVATRLLWACSKR